mmetsp:Transcript_65408/g.147031  ORF Transcript_65408/g.147031 Transcript_65408/m.147031 type:complete len:91 (-) Transcript_65408:167-439(-)
MRSESPDLSAPRWKGDSSRQVAWQQLRPPWHCPWHCIATGSNELLLLMFLLLLQLLMRIRLLLLLRYLFLLFRSRCPSFASTPLARETML